MSDTVSSSSAVALPLLPLPPPPRRPHDPRWFECGVLWLLLVGSLVFFGLMAERPLVSQGVYLDENGLMALGGRSDLHADHDAALAALRQLERDARQSCSSAERPQAMREWIRTQMKHMDMATAVYEHTHSASSSQLALGATALLPTIVTSGIWHAPKSDGKECLVLVTEYDQSDILSSAGSSGAGGGGSVSGLSILLTVLKFLSQRSGRDFFSRDVILVAVERQQALMANSSTAAARDQSRQRAVDAFGGWMDSYKSGDGVSRAGSIFTTLVVDVPFGAGGDSDLGFEAFSLDSVGFYGLAPNLDLPSLVMRLFENFGVPIHVAESVVNSGSREEAELRLLRTQEQDAGVASSLSTLFSRFAPACFSKSFYSLSTPNEFAGELNLDPWGVVNPTVVWAMRTLGLGSQLPYPVRWHMVQTSLGRWKGLWRFMIQALQGGRGQYHAHAIRFGIDALTIKAIPSSSRKNNMTPQEKMAVAYKTAQALDSILRSLNNLVEKLHHSTWWYMLNTRSDFVTMSKHIFAAVLPLGCLALRALDLLGASILTGSSHRGAAPGATGQAWTNSLALVAATYAVALSAFFGVDVMAATVGQGEWNKQAQQAWMALVSALLAGFFLLVLPRFSMLRRRRRNSVAAALSPSIVALQPRHLAEADAREAAAILAIAAAKNPKKAAAPLSYSGLEIPFSPPGLPLLVPSALQSPSASVPTYSASLDWRTFHSLLLLCVVGCLAPIMVLNTPACLLSLLFTLPLALLSRADTWPSGWISALELAALKDPQGRPIHFGIIYTRPFCVARYVLRAALHALVLLVCSPPMLLALYAHFHSLTWSAALQDLLQGLAPTSGSSGRAGTNLLYVTFFFAYLPCYIGSIVLAACTFKSKTTGASSANDKAAAGSADKKRQ